MRGLAGADARKAMARTGRAAQDSSKHDGTSYEAVRMGEPYWADVEVECVGQDLYRAVLVLGLGVREGGDEDIVRVPLLGEHPTAEEARLGARAAISAMAQSPR